MPYLVRENLYIGNIQDSAEILQNNSSQEGITHILSLLSSESINFFSEWKSEIVIPVKEIRKQYFAGSESEDKKEKLLCLVEYAGKELKLVRMAVPLRDMERENLLDYLDVCLDFIDSSRKIGGVLVHCFAGVSRSASIITAYLMKTEQLSVEDALQSLKESCDFVCPNDGFLDQLKMFEDMGFKVDHTSSVYKRFHLQVLGDSYNRGERIDSSQFGVDPGLPSATIDSSSESSVSPKESTKPNTAYRCKKCRRVVAVKDNVVDHNPGEGEGCFKWQKRSSGNFFNRYDDEPECSSIFVEPLRWMKTVEEGALEGKLFCPHCEARLGYFNWSGIQCSCGSWITPAFQLHQSRLDISTV
ncbi:hypothetical protein ACHQM5_012933 [Ranunculus cassubicifolius]